MAFRTRIRRRAAAAALVSTFMIGGVLAPASAAPVLPGLPAGVPGLPGNPAAIPGLPGGPAASPGSPDAPDDPAGDAPTSDGPANGLPGSAGGPAAASPGSSDDSPAIDDSFYDTSTVTPGAPGSILRTATAPTAPMPPELDYPLPSSVTKVLYSTTDMHGKAVPVSGYMVEPSVPWTGAGERPTVVIGRGTVGQGDQCAPSRNWPLDNQADPFSSKRLVNLEGLYDWVFAGAGVRVFVTDYIGMGTPGMHTYMNRAEQAHAMLDGARAARNLSGGNGKVAFYGHSQGGGASAAAVEEAASYAPDVPVAAAYASAPPADLDAVQRNIDGSDLVGAIGFTINGLAARYPEIGPLMKRHMNEQGQATLDALSSMCTNEITSAYGYQRTNEWTVGGRSLDEILGEIPEGRAAMEDQRIGRGKPSAPTMIVSGRHDENVEYRQARDLSETWCSNGGEVFYLDDALPKIGSYNHFAQAVSGAPFGIGFILAMFNGAPAAGACSGAVIPGGSGEIPVPAS
ncbi:lipase family protein [Corynebacterium hansenii]|uniref:Lipase family protein n=1 Tax=Corynebacterium hansenii TaxID=394964 RepID=A0ABV7ZPX0_9CORY|nr:lipase family protein [Corynebacterium hansenii]